MKLKRLKVSLNEAWVGVLEQDIHGRLNFTYNQEWLTSNSPQALSLSLPLRKKTYGELQTRPFFVGLLPEEGIRQNVARYLGISSNNDFSLLEAIGGECAGAVSLYPFPNNEQEHTPPSSKQSAQPLIKI